MKPILLLLLMSCGTLALDIERHGITWTITGTPTSGTYANGDPWVVGAITITAIDPAPAGGRNGFAVNPTIGTTQPFDDRITSHTYSASPSLPLEVSANSSVVSSVSTVDLVEYGQIANMAILTVVAEAPASGSFRPGYIGSGSRASSWTTNDMTFSVLADLDASALTDVPDIATHAGYFAKPWYEQNLGWSGRYLHPAYIPDYGRDMAERTGSAILLLNLDYTDAEKFDLLIGLVQYGIDIYWILSTTDAHWYADGGHNCGRLAPLITAAMVLDDAGMKAKIAASANNFQEFQQTFFVTQTDIDLNHTGNPSDPCQLQYEQADLGMPEWAIRHHETPAWDNPNWGTSYRGIGGGAIPATAVASVVMGAESVVGTGDALFAYAERHIYYRLGRYADAQYYNGFDDGDDYGEGRSLDSNCDQTATPYGVNQVPAFHSSFYLEHIGARPQATLRINATTVNAATVRVGE